MKRWMQMLIFLGTTLVLATASLAAAKELSAEKVSKTPETKIVPGTGFEGRVVVDGLSLIHI